MPNLELSTDEARVLREVLSTSLGELKTEIADTDARDFRETLRRKETVIATLLERLARS